VYKSVQSIRIEGSTKFGEKRWKHVCGNEATKFALCTDIGYALERGLVSYTKGITRSTFKCNHVIRLFNNVLLSKEQERNPLDGVDMSQFMVAKKSRGIVSFNRTRLGYCHQCNRMHDRENAAIKYVMGRPTFVCWRYASC
jgi:hypothetical protein